MWTYGKALIEREGYEMGESVSGWRYGRVELIRKLLDRPEQAVASSSRASYSVLPGLMSAQLLLAHRYIPISEGDG